MTGELAFLGFGPLRPFQRDAKSDFAASGGHALVTARIGQVLGTKADSAAGPGELPWRTEFGSRLHLLRHRKADAALVEFARAVVLEALARWERSVSVTSVDVLELGEPRALTLRVRYRLIDQGGAVLAEGTATVPVR